jgi:uncharacterized protein HemX
MATAKKGAKKKQSTATTAMEVGAGVLAAAAAAGAGYYFYGDKKAKQHRASATKWAKGMKADVIKEAKKLEKVSQKDIARIVDKATAAYSGVRSIDKKDLEGASRELKKHWKSVESEIQSLQKKVATAKKAVKKAVAPKKTPAKKTTKKAVKKAR